MIIFTQARGKVGKVSEGRPGMAGFFAVSIGKNVFQRAIMTAAAVDHNDNFQFLHTLWDTIYVYIFGTRIGTLTVSGVAFADTCWAGADGPREILTYYDANRIARKGTPVEVIFGSWGFQAFLTGVNVQIMDPERNLSQFSYRFSVFPEK